MKEHGILYSGPMVRAHLAGAKTETRRLSDRWGKAKPGDRLWVREAWKPIENPETGQDGYQYLADGAFTSIEDTQDAADRWVQLNASPNAWRSLFMPRWLCRTVLTLGDIRQERLQDIDEEGAVREGMLTVSDLDLYELGSRRKVHTIAASMGCRAHPMETCNAAVAGWWQRLSARDRFSVVICLINGPDVWASNQLVYVLAGLERVNEASGPWSDK